MSDEPSGPRSTVNRASTLLRQILVLNRELEHQLGEELGVNPTDLEAMQQLMTSGPLSPSTLAERLGVSTAAVTIAVDRLVKAGHVRRTPHPSDRRRLLVVPSEDSVRQAKSSVLPMVLETNALLDRYTDGEQAAIIDYLDQTVGVMTRRSTSGGAEETEVDGQHSSGRIIQT